MTSPAHLSPAMVSGDLLFLSGQLAFGPEGRIEGDVSLADAKGLCISFIAIGNISLGLGVGASLPGALTSGVVDGLSGLSWAIAVVAVPLALIAVLLFGASNRAPQEH